METLKLLIFVGTEGIYHDHAGNGQFLTSMLNGTDTIEADFSQDYDVLADGLERYDTVLFYTDVGELTASTRDWFAQLYPSRWWVLRTSYRSRFVQGI